MHYLIRLIRCFVFGLCICGIFSYSLVAQSSTVNSFELSQYELESGTSGRIDLALTVQNISANILEIQNSLPGIAFVVESVKIMTGENVVDIWLTRDQDLFAGNVPKTALITNLENSTFIRTASAVQAGDRVLIRLLVTISDKGHVQSKSELSEKLPDAAMTVAVSSSSAPEIKLQYISEKPILIKSRGTVK